MAKKCKKNTPTFTYSVMRIDHDNGWPPEKTLTVYWIDAPTREIADAEFEEKRYRDWFEWKEGNVEKRRKIERILRSCVRRISAADGAPLVIRGIYDAKIEEVIAMLDAAKEEGYAAAIKDIEHLLPQGGELTERFSSSKEKAEGER